MDACSGNGLLGTQAAFTTAPILRHFQPSLPLTIEADAFDFGLGCVLSQTDETGELHPLAYYSRKFCAAELSCPIYDKELLTIVAAFRQWRVYLKGAAHPLVVYTDHKNLEYFQAARTTSRRYAGWAETLAAYDFSIVYRKGSSNGKPDALSRRPDYLPPAQSPHPLLPEAALLPIPPLRATTILLSPSDPLLPTIKEAQLVDPAL